MKETNNWELTPKLFQEIDKFNLEEGVIRRRWFLLHSNRQPLYSPTGEKGAFVGIFGYLTGAGVREFPFYKTQSGIYFYFWEDLDHENKKIQQIEIDKLSVKWVGEEWLHKHTKGGEER